MDFYTNVSRFGNNLLYRIQRWSENSKKNSVQTNLVCFHTKPKSGWRTLFDEPVDPIEFDSMRDATDFTKDIKE